MDTTSLSHRINKNPDSVVDHNQEKTAGPSTEDEIISDTLDVTDNDHQGYVGATDANGNQEIVFQPRKNVSFHHELLANATIFMLSMWWIVGCISYGVVCILYLTEHYILGSIILFFCLYPKLFKIQPWPLFRWFMAKGGRPLDFYAKKGYTLIFQHGAYEAIARTDPSAYLSKSQRVKLSSSEKENILGTISNQLQDSQGSKDPILMSYHPHGVFPISYYLSGVCCEPLFRVNPNIRFLIASVLFNAPIWKFLVGWLDKFDSAEKSSMTGLMKKGKDIALLPGGFEEATIYERNVHRIYIKQRTGFIKYALQYGYNIVPVYTFGEEKNFFNLPGLLNLRLWLNKHHIPGVLFFGKFFTVAFSSHSMHTIYGAPLKCPKIENPTSEQVAHYHSLYINRVIQIFEENKARCGQPNATLEIW